MAEKFKVGDRVTFINEYDVKFPEREVVGLDLRDGREPRYFVEPNSAPWFSIKESMLIHDAEDTVLAIEGGHKIRHATVNGSPWFMVGMTQHVFATMELASQYARDNQTP